MQCTAAGACLATSARPTRSDVCARLFGDDVDAVAQRLDQAISGQAADQVRTTGTGETVTPLPPKGRSGR